MTGIEAQAAASLDDGRSLWSRLLVPVLTAVLVLALGLVLVGLTGDDAESTPARTEPAASPLR
jgi:hypothetical protein